MLSDIILCPCKILLRVTVFLSCFCSVCAAEHVNGDIFLSITAEVLRACEFKAGEIVLISKYIKMPYEKVSSYHVFEIVLHWNISFVNLSCVSGTDWK